MKSSLDSITGESTKNWSDRDWLEWYSANQEKDEFAELHVREAKRSDFSSIEKIASKTKFECEPKTADRIYVAEREKRIVGFTDIVYNPECDTDLIRLIAVHPGFRGKGVGSALLGYIIEDGRRYQAKIHYDNDASLALFIKMGFVELGRTNGLVQVFYGCEQ